MRPGVLRAGGGAGAGAGARHGTTGGPQPGSRAARRRVIRSAVGSGPVAPGLDREAAAWAAGDQEEVGPAQGQDRGHLDPEARAAVRGRPEGSPPGITLLTRQGTCLGTDRSVAGHGAGYDRSGSATANHDSAQPQAAPEATRPTIRTGGGIPTLSGMLEVILVRLGDREHELGVHFRWSFPLAARFVRSAMNSTYGCREAATTSFDTFGCRLPSGNVPGRVAGHGSSMMRGERSR